jgi:hypothetical protein
MNLLVTFIACEIVTGRGLTKILGGHPGPFAAAKRQGRDREFRPSFILPSGNPFAPVHLPINMAAPTSQKAGGAP